MSNTRAPRTTPPLSSPSTSAQDKPPRKNPEGSADLFRFRKTNSPASSASRRLSRGALAEEIAARDLERRGIEILGRNVRVGRAEIDLLARDGEVILVIEVKTRGPRSYQRALDSIDAKKRARLRRAGEQLWAERYARDMRIQRMRFDAIAVDLDHDGGPIVEHIKAAF